MKPEGQRLLVALDTLGIVVIVIWKIAYFWKFPSLRFYFARLGVICIGRH
jgi:hypothetical protein